MTAATLDLPTRADGQLDNDQPLQQLADAVAALWSAGTGLALQPAQVALDDTHATVVLAEPSPPGGREEPPEALLSRLDRPFGRRARDLACVLQASVRELLGHPLTRVRARDRREQGRVVVELSLAPAFGVGVIPRSLPQGRPLDPCEGLAPPL
jgi:hypothetical protein